MRHIATAAMAALILFGPVAGVHAAGFGSNTVCFGKMNFPSPDGSSETCDMRLTFSDATYLIVTPSLEQQNATSDEGSCESDLSGTCRHDLPVHGEPGDDYHTFKLRPVTATDFAYEDIWKDGAVRRMIVTCRAS